MRKITLILATIITVIGIVFSFLPMDTLAFLPIGLGLILSFLAFRNSDESQKKFPKILLIIGIICTIYVLGKTIFIKDEIAEDTTFEKQKIESKKEDKKELEELENDLE